MSAPTRLIGASDPNQFYGTLMYDALEHVPELQPGYQANLIYSKMRRESRLAAVLAGYTLQIRRASWQVDPAGCRPEVVAHVADDMGLTVAGKDKPGAARTAGVSWNDHLRSALMELTYGHMAHELLAEVDDSGKAHLVALAERMPHTIDRIESDPKTGKLLGVTQEGAGWKDGVPQIGADRLAFYCHDKEGSWAGTSLFRSSWAPFYLKQELLKVHAIGVRRFSMGVPTVEWDKSAIPTPGQMSAAQQLASAARVGEEAGAALPPGASLILRGLSGGVPDALGFIKFLNSEIAISCLMPHIDLGTSETGSRAVASTFVDSWLLALGSIADEIADVATRQIAARIVGWNWQNEPVPRIVTSGIGAKREVTAESLQMLLSSGALSADPGLEEYIRREWRLPEREEMAAPKVTAPGVDLPEGKPVEVQAAARPRSSRRRPAKQQSLFGDDDDPAAVAARIQQQWSDAKDRLMKRWPKLAKPMVTELAGQAEAAVKAGDLALLGELQVSAGVVAAVALPLRKSGTDLARQAAAGVVEEAANQGVDIHAPGEPGADRVEQHADAVARIIASGYASGAARMALQLSGMGPAEVKDAVAAHLTELGTSENGLVGENIGGLLSAAQHAGRLAVLEEHPADAYEASETNDSHRCKPCADADKVRFGTLADALAVYPTSGNRHCLGGGRCRGFLRPIFN